MRRRFRILAGKERIPSFKEAPLEAILLFGSEEIKCPSYKRIQFYKDFTDDCSLFGTSFAVTKDFVWQPARDEFWEVDGIRIVGPEPLPALPDIKMARRAVEFPEVLEVSVTFELP